LFGLNPRIDLSGLSGVFQTDIDKDKVATSDDIVIWTTQIRRLKGEPFTFDRREYLLPIYRDTHPNVYVVKGRQVEFTEFAINWLLFHLSKNPFTTGFYATDTLEKVSSFSMVRLKEQAIGHSPILRQMFVDDGSVHHMGLPNGSHLYMFSGFKEFKMSRQFTIDWAVIDEAQNQELRAINVIDEAQSHSKFKRKLVLGTGSLEGDAWHKLWLTGDQKEWDPQAKAWVAKHPENIKVASSYHLPQWVVPWISAEEIERKRREYLPRLFTTEVEGWFFKGAEKPLSEAAIRALFDNNLHFVPAVSVNKGQGPVFMGIDWGGGTKAYTIFWVWQAVATDIPRFRVLYLSKVAEKDTEKQADMAIQLIDSYDPDQVVMDAGGGTRQVQKLADRYGLRTLMNFYTERPGQPLEIDYDHNAIKTDRTWGIESIIDLITRPAVDGHNRILIPHVEADKVDWIIDHFTAIEAQNVQLPSGKTYVRYDHPQEQPDDALHGCNYAKIAFEVWKQGVGNYNILPVTRR